MKALDFNKLKKTFLNVTFPDEKQTFIMIMMPTKKILEEFVDLHNVVKNSENQEKVMDAFYGVVAKVMSHNMSGVTITKSFLEEHLDFEDIMIFVKSYTEFVQDITSQKN